MTPHRLAGCLAVLLIPLAATAAAAEPPSIGGVVNTVAAKATVSVNGVPVATFETGADGSGGQTMFLSGWLANGTNEVVLTVAPTGERARATLELQDFDSEGTLLALEQQGAGERRGTIEGAGLPDWAWTAADPQAEPSGLAEAVAALHGAYGKGDIDAIVAASAPALTDQAALGGMGAEMFREEVQPLFAIATLADLPALSTDRYLDGRLFRVTDPEGNPPIELKFEQDGMKGAISTGEWWSMIDGTWQLAR